MAWLFGSEARSVFLKSHREGLIGTGEPTLWLGVVFAVLLAVPSRKLLFRTNYL
jgi:hypothetical protein